MNKSLFQQTADLYGISLPALVEKDYYVVDLLKSIHDINLESYDLIFTGGTCLTKAHINTNRLSEDIDFKIAANESILNSSRAQRKKIKKNIYEQIKDKINSLSNFEIINKFARNEYGLQLFEIRYPSQFSIPDFIRPYIKLELFESIQFKKGINCSVKSLVNKASNSDPEINKINCSPITVIAAEKLVALLRRTAAEIRGIDQHPDTTLVRHAYDLHVIFKQLDIKGQVLNIVPQIIKNDIEQFGNKDLYFKDSPITEMKTALKYIIENNTFANRYNMFLNPLVYDIDPPSWDEVKASLEILCEEFFT